MLGFGWKYTSSGWARKQICPTTITQIRAFNYDKYFCLKDFDGNIQQPDSQAATQAFFCLCPQRQNRINLILEKYTPFHDGAGCQRLNMEQSTKVSNFGHDGVCIYNFLFLPESDVKLSTENCSFFCITQCLISYFFSESLRKLVHY